MSYFKFQTEAALAAWDHVEVQTSDLQKTGQAFAELFGGKAVFQYTVTSRWFTGIQFNSQPEGHNPALWTAPTKQNGFSSVPLKNFPRGKRWESNEQRNEAKQQHAELLTKWNDNYPAQRVNKEGLLSSIGFDWGMLFLTGIIYFRLADVIYAETSAKPDAAAMGIEILGSEFADAKRELTAQIKEAQPV